MYSAKLPRVALFIIVYHIFIIFLEHFMDRDD
jgi:hypothetical protein